MRRRTPRLLALALALAAALVPGAAVFSRAEAATCLDIDFKDLGVNLTEAEVVVVARVEASEPERSVVLRPEVYLKGPAQSAVISLSFPDPRPRCPLARFDPGARVLAVLDAAGGDLSWPGAGDVWLIAGGVATKPEPSPDERPEADLIRAVRSITGQYAVPAANGEEGASIDWVGTVLPVSAALLVVFAIGLLLMRTWHRIDPS